MLNKAIAKTKCTKGLLLHSDQGVHYQIERYQKFLKSNNITQSMSRKGNCLDNSIIENFFGVLKNEMYYNKKFDDVDALKKNIIEYIEYYNNERITVKLKGLSPVVNVKIKARRKVKQKPRTIMLKYY